MAQSFSPAYWPALVFCHPERAVPCGFAAGHRESKDLAFLKVTDLVTASESLQVIVGRQLGSVEFVQDYVQLRFDGPCLTAFTHPTVMVRQQLFRWDNPRFRDELCGRISKKVVGAEVKPEDRLTIKFEDGSEVQISLKDADYAGPEAAKFDYEKTLWVL